MLDSEACYQALLARDERFDGRIFVGVSSTGIYCRPICPAPPARSDRCHFYASAAAAQAAGFRPCLRCRPESAPETASWRGTSNTVTRGLVLIARGELDREGATVAGFAERLGVGERQLRRLFERHLGASPVAIAQTRRVLFAKQLIHETRLPMVQIALAAGFGSLRRFNETFRALYGRPPSTLRDKRTRAERSAPSIEVRLRYRPPYDWQAMLAYLKARAVPGLEVVDDHSYSRVVRAGDVSGTVRISHDASLRCLVARVDLELVTTLSDVVTRVRNLFDLNADVDAISAHLRRDELLKPWVEQRPGLRVAGAWDGFEYALRAILGQQVSLGAARQLLAKVVLRAGIARPTPDEGLTHSFPSAEQVLATRWDELGVPKARAKSLLAMAQAALAQPDLFLPAPSLEQNLERLSTISGVGPWTAHTIALRAVRNPDAFPAGDRGLQRGAERLGLGDVTALQRHAARWQPFRGYAAAHLWLVSANAEPRDATHQADERNERPSTRAKRKHAV